MKRWTGPKINKNRGKSSRHEQDRQSRLAAERLTQKKLEKNNKRWEDDCEQ